MHQVIQNYNYPVPVSRILTSFLHFLNFNSFSDEFGSLNVFCDVTYLAKMFCHSFKLIDYSCSAIDLNEGPLADAVKRLSNLSYFSNLS